MSTPTPAPPAASTTVPERRRPETEATPAPALRLAVVQTPFGPVALVVTPEDEVLRAAGFGSAGDLVARLAPALRRRGVVEVPPDRLPGPAAAALARYADGDVDALAGVPHAQPGGPFLQQAWLVMAGIPAGETWTYAELAAKAGRPAAVRAAGQSCARNLVAPFVPCHRVVRSGGSLGGYGFGLAVKAALLRHEGALL
jgi:methylated-DNA-[protein]-cysteine S-methyltransferase